MRSTGDRLAASILAVALGAVVTVLADAPDEGVSSETDPVSLAAASGLQWLVGPGRSQSSATDLVNLNKLYRVVADEDVAAYLRATLSRLDAEVAPTAIPDDLSARRYLLWRSLDPLVKQVVKDRCEEAASPKGADRLAAHIQEHEGELLARLPLSQKIVATYYLEQSGLGSSELYEDALEELRAALDAFPEGTSLANDPFLVYAVTHVVFTRSGYYDRYLDPSDFEPELAAIRSAAQSIAERGVPPIDIDVAAELLVALKLLRVPPDDTVETIRRRLVAQQNQDGSWNGMSGVSRHTSVVCTLALTEFAPKLRGEGNIWCAPR